MNLTLGDEPAKKYKPLEEVAEQIREELAAPLARENIDRAILKAQARMDSYYGKYLAWEQQGKEAGEAPPALPTFEDLAVDGVELKVNSIPLADKYEVVKMDGLGAAVDFRFDGRGIQQTLFIQVAYGNSLRVFQGQSFPGPSSKTRYVYWVTDRAEADVQTFEGRTRRGRPGVEDGEGPRACVRRCGESGGGGRRERSGLIRVARLPRAGNSSARARSRT